jgi:hypothetical protein
MAGASTAAVEETDEDAAVARIVSRLSSEYVLRATQLLIEAYGDIRTGLIAQTIVTANTAHLDTRGGDGWRYAAIDETPPDELRRPISIARLAESLGLPFETTRRHVQRLIDAGVCIRVERGLIVPRAVLEAPAAAGAALANVGYVRKFVRDLHAAGLGSEARAEAAGSAAAHGRSGHDDAQLAQAPLERTANRDAPPHFRAR